MRITAEAAVAEALKPDDPEWCRCEAKGEEIVIEVKTDKIGALLYALDDYLMHIRMCKEILKILTRANSYPSQRFKPL